ncbi:helix-turn-helix transcriptional regulator [Chryseobacterium sp. SG20098]|uniref:helix-turn-helix domain-containing protein n=1 Tax=Chryseobacterium sp. SG20098 TaxID=3074145 RepID=UPI0028834CA0|nr:helix-turn-helix transcriptional regulator [Chryseobacterium sp. SG20098]WNI34706.1 helix-turn-helix transcriptional regulator [Chryseobacterium sp. SG20098]
MTIGQVIKILLKKKNITQLQLAEKIGKSTTAISQIVKGQYSPTPETLEKISKVVDVPVPVMHFLTISEKDIPDDKKQLYNLLAPSMNKFLNEIFEI